MAEKSFSPRAFVIYAKRLGAQHCQYGRGRSGDADSCCGTDLKGLNNAVWRRADNEKWYGALLTVEKQKLGIKSHDTAEIIDLRADPEEVKELIKEENYYPGWHMNKKHWYTVILDGSVAFEEI